MYTFSDNSYFLTNEEVFESISPQRMEQTINIFLIKYILENLSAINK